MTELKQYQKRRDQEPVIAIRLTLGLGGNGVAYRKWGGEQWAKQGDWLVENAGEVYSVDADSFAATYEKVGPGQYIKTGKVWAEIAEADGEIQTKEGFTFYRRGDYLVYNGEGRADGYAIKPEKFEAMYEVVA